jgi:ribosomal protein S18 acetylase RimI-like enzyme
MRVRDARLGDRAGVRAAARAAWHATYRAIPTADIDATVDAWYGDAALAAAFEEPFLVADDERVVGFVHASPAGGTATLARLYVRPERWREGVGSRLLDAAESRLRDRSVWLVRLLVLASNDRARRFYEAQGYAAVDRTTDEIAGRAYDQQVMEKGL